MRCKECGYPMNENTTTHGEGCSLDQPAPRSGGPHDRAGNWCCQYGNYGDGHTCAKQPAPKCPRYDIGAEALPPYEPAAPVEGLPECPNYIAHPQSVWFNEHWRPAFERVKREYAFAKDHYADVLKDYCERDDKLTARVQEHELKERNLIANWGEANDRIKELEKALGYAKEKIGKIGGPWTQQALAEIARIVEGE